MYNNLVVVFAGGLGNQMFQYSLYRRLVSEGKTVKCVITNDSNGPFPFKLDIFPSVDYQTIPIEEYLIRKDIYQRRSLIKKFLDKVFPNAKEFYFEDEHKAFDDTPFKMNKGFINGYFQGVDYINPIKEELLDAFYFPVFENNLTNLINTFSSNTVSLHVRRGDYLTYSDKYGGICTEEYYRKAIAKMVELGHKEFVVLSNDIEWVKANLNIDNAIFIDEKIFEHYQDWYDMYIMSKCSHNIIANSTFSWWGAWLNRNPYKIVITPPYFDNFNKKNSLVDENWIVVTG